MTIDTIIEEESVTLPTLSVELERATIAHKMSDDQSLYVIEPGMFPFWIEIHPKVHFVLLHSYLQFVPDSDSVDRLELCDRINREFYLPACHVRQIEREGEADSFRLIGNYALYYRDGLFPSQFIRLCRQFSSGMKRVEVEFDPMHQLIEGL